jgi:hypothetical protein
MGNSPGCEPSDLRDRSGIVLLVLVDPQVELSQASFG